MRTCSPDREWAKANALRHSGKSEPCVHRESRLVQCSLSLLLREKRAEKENEKSTTEENEGREKEARTRKRRRGERGTPLPSSPCVGSKRLRVSVHTETFRTYTRFFFRVPSRVTHHTHHTTQHTTQHTQQYTTTPKHKNAHPTHSQHIQHTRTTISTHTHHTPHTHVNASICAPRSTDHDPRLDKIL